MRNADLCCFVFIEGTSLVVSEEIKCGLLRFYCEFFTAILLLKH